VAGDATDGPRTLLALGAANTTGMTLAGIGLLVATRRAAGAAAMSGVLRTTGVLLAGGTAGALVGRWLTDAVHGAAGSAVPSALGSGVVGAVAAVTVVAAAVVALDRRVVRDLRHLDRPAAVPEQAGVEHG
jgi:putative peptidoglycan lipid II flippase